MPTSLPPEPVFSFFQQPERPATHGLVRFYRYAAVVLAVLAGVAAGHSQTEFGPVPIGGSSSATVAVTMQAGGTVNVVQVYTQGAVGTDFSLASGGTCAANTFSAGQTCNQPVQFKPAYPGSRTGAVVLLDSSGKVLATSYLA